MKIINFYQTATEYLFSKLPLAEKYVERPGVTASTATYEVKMSQIISQEESSLLTRYEYQARVIPESWYREAGSYECIIFVTNNLLTGG